jgi:hypothetical protein
VYLCSCLIIRGMKRSFLFLMAALVAAGCGKSSDANAQVHELEVVKALEQQSFPQTVTPGDYSGISMIDESHYAVVSDKSGGDGFFIFEIKIDKKSGTITSASNSSSSGTGVSFLSAGGSNRDAEGIVYFPAGASAVSKNASASSGSGTVFISGEADKAVYEYDMKGARTGRKLNIPTVFSGASSNYGFESLAYNAKTHLFWTTTESTIPSDGTQATAKNGVCNVLRFQSFDENLQPVAQYVYKMDAPSAAAAVEAENKAAAEKKANAAKNGGSDDSVGDLFSMITSVASQVLSQSSVAKGAAADMPYAMGVSELLALDDGSLIVLEREFYIPSGIIGARVVCKLYHVNPADCKPIAGSGSQFSAAIPSDAQILPKRLLYQFTTAIKSLNDFNIANYEGMCLGPVLNNGNQTIILISDSQSGYKGILQDWFKVLEIK